MPRCPAYTKLSEDAFLFPDSAQCDKYWTCTGGQARRSLCPDGLVFHPDKAEGEDPCNLRLVFNTFLIDMNSQYSEKVPDSVITAITHKNLLYLKH